MERAGGNSALLQARPRRWPGVTDAENKALTIILYDVDGQAKYLNQEWNITKPSFAGEAVPAAYNDRPLANGTQMGPFYEIESVSPAAFLKPGASLSHRHAFVFHFYRR